MLVFLYNSIFYFLRHIIYKNEVNINYIHSTCYVAICFSESHDPLSIPFSGLKHAWRKQSFQDGQSAH